MAIACDDIFCIAFEGADSAALRRGLAAARAIFDRADVDPRVSELASRKREARAAGSDREVSEQEHDLADLWWEAAEAAWSAVAPDWQSRQPKFGVSGADGEWLLGTPYVSAAENF